MEKALLMHGLMDHAEEGSAAGNPTVMPGVGGTYPTFLFGDQVVKLLGHVGPWNDIYKAEVGAHAIVAGDANILVPSLIGTGYLFDGCDESWPYLITERVQGLSWDDCDFARDMKVSAAVQLGKQLTLVHGLKVQRFSRELKVQSSNFMKSEIENGLKKSSLPSKLISYVPDFLKSFQSVESEICMVHADLIGRHVFFDDGVLSGIIDWGDATMADREYELSKLHLDLFSCDKNLLKEFLNASCWQVSDNFARKALAMAIVRQIQGANHHLTFDTFYKIGSVDSIEEVESLGDLADLLFAV